MTQNGNKQDRDMAQNRAAKRAKKQGAEPARFAGARRRDRQALLASTALQATVVILLSFPAGPGLAQQIAATARPQGGTVVGGQASIGQSPAQTTVQQGSQRAAIDWRSYDVGSGHTVLYQQPNAQAIVLNRVTGPDPSVIAGRIQANGQVVLVNGSGVVFTRGSQVDVQSLVVSSAGVTNGNFMAGKMVFDQPGRPDARISNAGRITVAETGLAALVAPQVANSGLIQAKMGHVVLAGAEAHTVDLYGDGLMSVDVTRQVTRAPGGGTALVTNTGTVMADGGTILLTAKAADGIVQNLVSAKGKLQANSVGERTGTVMVSAVGGTISIEGAIQADGRAPGTRGGTVVLNADNVAVQPAARISANGRAGGGTVAVGTTAARAQAQGNPAAGFPAGTAQTVTIADGARISADGRGNGSGGTVAVLSSNRTVMAGRITARGGKNGGDGGRVEISGQQGLRITGTVDTTAPKGKIGTLTIDPDTLVIGDNVATANPAAPNPDGTNQPATGAQTISAATFNAFASNINLQATNSITLQGATVLTGGNHTIILTGTGAAATINVNVGINTIGSVALVGGAGAGGLVTVNAAVKGNGVTLSGNSVSFTSTGSVDGGTRVALNANTLTLAAGSTVTSTQTVAVAPLTAGTTLSIDAVKVAGRLSLTPADVAILAPAGGPTTLVLGSTNAAPSAANSTAGSINFNTPLAVNPATLGLFNTGDVTQGVLAVLNVNTLAGDTSGAVVLNSAANVVSNLGGYTAGTSFALNTPSTALQLTGALTSGPVDLTAASLSQTAAGKVTASTFNSNTTGAVTLNVATNAISNLGNVTAGGDFTLENTGTALGVTGTINLGTHTLNVNALSLTESGSGVITAGSLTGTFPNDVSLLANPNAITSLGSLSLGGNFLLNDGTVALNLTNALNASGHTIRLDAGSLSQTAAGVITAATFTGSTTGTANLSTANNAIVNLGAFTNTSGDFSLKTTGSLNISGTVDVTGHTLAFTTGGLTEGASGTLKASTLTGSTTGTVALGQTNTIVNLGTFTNTSGDFALKTGGSLNVSGTVDVTGHTLTLTTAGLTEGASGLLKATTLAGSTTGTVTLGRSNAIVNLGAFTNTSGDFSLTNTGVLNIAGTVDVTGHTLTLNTGGLTEGASGLLKATTLAGSSTGTVTLNQTNTITNLGAFTNTAGDFALTTGASLNISGTVDVTGHTLTLTTGGLTEGASGTLTAATLTGSTTGTVALNQANTITNLGAFTNTSGDFSLNNGASALGLTGTVDATGHTIALTAGTLNLTGGSGGHLTASRIELRADAWSVTGAAVTSLPATGVLALAPRTVGGFTIGSGAGNLTSANILALLPASSIDTVQLGNTSTAPTAANSQATTLTLTDALVLTGRSANLALFSQGSIIESGAGAVTVATLTGASGGTVTLGGSNNVTNLGAFTNTSGDFSLTNTGVLNIAGTVDVTGHTLTLNTGGLTEGASGLLKATALAGSSTGTVTLGQTNTITNLGAFTNTAGDFALTTGASLNISGTVDVTGHTLTLTTGGLTEGASGTLTAATLTGSTAGTVALNQANTITNLGTFTNTSGDFSLNNGASALGLTGTVDATGHTIALTAGTLNLTGGSGGHLTASRIELRADAWSVTGAAVTSLPATGVLALAPRTVGGFTIGSGAGNLTSANILALLPASSIDTVQLGNTSTAPTAANSQATTLTLTDALVLTGRSANLALFSQGSIIESGAGAVTVATLTGASGGTVTLGGSNNVTNLGAFTNTSGDFSLTNTGVLNIAGTVDVTGHTLTLNTGGLTEGASGLLKATTLAGSSTGTVTLNQTNTITNLGAFTNTAGDFALTTGASLNISGTVDVTGHTLTLTTGGLTEGASGTLTAATLTGSTAGTVALNQANTITNLGTFTNTSGDFSLNNTGNLNIAGTVDVTGHTLTLNTGGLTEGPSGTLKAATLTGGTSGTATLDQTNTVANLGTFTNTAGDFTLKTGGVLNVSGTVDVTGHTLTLITAGLTESALGIINAGTLAGSTTGTVTLGQTNTIANLGTFTNTSGDFSLKTGNSLNIAGTVDITGHTLTLTTGGLTEGPLGLLKADTLTGSTTGTVTLGQTNTIANLGTFTNTAGDFLLTTGGILNISGTVDVTGHTLTLTTAGLTEGALGLLKADTLAGSSTGTVTLTQNNVVANLGTFTNTAGDFALNTTGGLNVSGTVDVSGHTLTLTTGNTAGIGLSEGAAGLIKADTLTGSTTGSTTLTRNNVLANLGTFTNTLGDFALNTTGGLNVSGTVDVSGHTLTLTTGNTAGIGLSEGAAGLIKADTLSGSTTGSATLTQANVVANLGTFTNTAGDFALNTTGGLNVSGTVDVTSHTLTLTTGNTAGIGLSENAGTITAGTLTGSTTGTVTLDQTNAISNLGPFTNISGDFTLNDGITALTIIGALNAGIHTVTLTAGSIGQTAPGLITAGLLTGSAGSVDLPQGNVVTTLGQFTASAGDFTFTNAGALTVAGPVAAAAGTATITVQAGTMTVSPVALPALATITAKSVILAATDVIATGTVGACTVAGAGGDVTVTAGNTITVSGSGVIGGQSSAALTAATIFQNGAGSLIDGPAVTLTGDFNQSAGRTIGGTVTLTGTLTQAGGTIWSGSGFSALAPQIDGTIASGGNITLTGVTSVTGSVQSDASVSIATPSTTSLALSGTVLAKQDLTVVQGTKGVAGGNGGGITQTAGVLSAGRDVLIYAADGAAAQSGGRLAGTRTVQVISMAADNSFTPSVQPVLTGSVGTPTTFLCPGCTGSADPGLPGTITGVLFTSRPATVRLDGVTLTLARDVAGDAVTLHSVGNTNATGAVSAGTLSGTAGYASSGFDLNLLPTYGTLTSVTAGAGAATLANAANSVLRLGDYQALSGFTFADTPGAPGLTIAGTVRAGLATDPLAATAANAAPLSITVQGAQGNLIIGDALAPASTMAGGAVSLTATGSISEAADSVLVANSLTGSAASAALPGANQVATLAAFTAPGGFALTNSRNLTVAGPVSAVNGTVRIIAQNGVGTPSVAEGQSAGIMTIAAGANPATITGKSVALTASSFVVDGTIGACVVGGGGGDTSLVAGAGTIAVNGTAVIGGQASVAMTAATINQSGAASLIDAPTVALNGAFNQSAGRVVGGAVTVTGPLNQTGGSIWSGAAFSALAPVVGGAVASGGNVTLTGVGAVSGSILSDASISVAANAATPLALSGTLVAQQDVTVVQGTRQVAGSGGGITQSAGSVSAGRDVLIYAADGAASQTGGTVAGARTVQVVSLPGDNSFTPSVQPVLSGAVGAPVSFLCPGCIGSADPGNPGALSGTLGTIRPVTVRLDGATLTLIRPVAADTVDLHSTGNATVSGAVGAGVLKGTAGYRGSGFDANGLPTYGTLTTATAGIGSATFSNAANTVLRLGDYQARSGFTFIDTPGAPGLTIAGTVRAGLASDPLTAAAPNGPPLSISVLGPNGNLIIGDAAAPASNLAGSAVTLSAMGSISEAAGSLVAAGTLAASAGNGISLPSVTNNIAATGTVSGGAGAVLLTDAVALQVNGPMSGTDLALTAPGLTLAGNMTGSGTVTLTSTAGIVQTGGVITAPLLTGSAATTAAFGQANQLLRLGAFTTGGNFTLVNGRDLDVTGAVVAGPVPPTGASPTLKLTVSGALALNGGSLTAGTVDVQASGPITEPNGFIVANTLTASASQLTADSAQNQIAVLSAATAPGGIVLVDSRSLTTTGPVSAANGPVTLTVTGDLVTQAPVSAGTDATIRTSGAFTAASTSSITARSLSSASGGATSIAGQVTTSGPAVLSANGLTVGGTVVSTGDAVSLSAGTGNLLQTGTVRAATTVTETSGRAAPAGSSTFTGGGAVTLGPGSITTAGRSISVSASTTATLAGTESAPLIVVTAPSEVLQNGTINVGGVVQASPKGVPPASLPTLATSTVGLFLEAGSQLTTTGTTFINPLAPSTQATIRVDLTSGSGTITFGNVTAPQGNMILDLGTGSASGGFLTLNNLTVLYTGQGFSGGTVNLTGSIANQVGSAAAGTAVVAPQPNRDFRLNNCAIGSVNCVVLQPLLVPVGNPLKELYLNFFRPDDFDSDLLLPNTSDQGL